MLIIQDLTILGNPIVRLASIPAFETIRYGGTCQESKNNTNMVIQSKKYTYNETFNVITTNTNTCEVVNGFYD